jgi:catechol 2,3-dioxygenase-like lactoylglutathione lyase family enzyme
MDSNNQLAAQRQRVTGVHSIERFAFSVPSVEEAEHFYNTFGLDVRRSGDSLELRTFGNSHCWGVVHARGAAKRLEYVSYGIFAVDVERFAARIAKAGIGHTAHPLSDGQGLWLTDPDGVALQLKVAPKVSPSAKSVPTPLAAPARGNAAAPARSQVKQIRPRRLSHILRFTPDVPRMMEFCRDVLGMGLSDHSRDLIAFMHGIHGSDHHLTAFAKSDKPGLHHSSWDVGSIDEVGLGSEQMRSGGFDEGWWVVRHVLGSNYFYYVRDPWKSWAEYSFDIDFIPPDGIWNAGNYAPEDSLYVWGPGLHPEFITNFEPTAS